MKHAKEHWDSVRDNPFLRVAAEARKEAERIDEVRERQEWWKERDRGRNRTGLPSGNRRSPETRPPPHTRRRNTSTRPGARDPPWPLCSLCSGKRSAPGPRRLLTASRSCTRLSRPTSPGMELLPPGGLGLGGSRGVYAAKALALIAEAPQNAHCPKSVFATFHLAIEPWRAARRRGRCWGFLPNALRNPVPKRSARKAAMGNGSV